jgi:hypothetical protein
MVESDMTWRTIFRYGRAKKSTRPYHICTAALLRLVPTGDVGTPVAPVDAGPADSVMV